MKSPTDQVSSIRVGVFVNSLVPFPFTDQLDSKKRPAVIISSAAYNKTKPDLIIMAITSQIKPTQGLGEFQVQEWQQAGLLKPSVLSQSLPPSRSG